MVADALYGFAGQLAGFEHVLQLRPPIVRSATGRLLVADHVPWDESSVREAPGNDRCRELGILTWPSVEAAILPSEGVAIAGPQLVARLQFLEVELPGDWFGVDGGAAISPMSRVSFDELHESLDEMARSVVDDRLETQPRGLKVQAALDVLSASPTFDRRSYYRMRDRWQALIGAPTKDRVLTRELASVELAMDAAEVFDSALEDDVVVSAVVPATTHVARLGGERWWQRVTDPARAALSDVVDRGKPAPRAPDVPVFLGPTRRSEGSTPGGRPRSTNSGASDSSFELTNIEVFQSDPLDGDIPVITAWVSLSPDARSATIDVLVPTALSSNWNVGLRSWRDGRWLEVTPVVTGATDRTSFARVPLTSRSPDDIQLVFRRQTG